MKITDNLSITEISRLTGKSRPTIYKYISDYEKGSRADIPADISQLFDILTAGKSIKEVYSFCEENFIFKQGNEEYNEILNLIAANKDKINFQQLKKYIIKEIEKNGK